MGSVERVHNSSVGPVRKVTWSDVEVVERCKVRAMIAVGGRGVRAEHWPIGGDLSSLCPELHWWHHFERVVASGHFGLALRVEDEDRVARAWPIARDSSCWDDDIPATLGPCQKALEVSSLAE